MQWQIWQRADSHRDVTDSQFRANRSWRVALTQRATEGVQGDGMTLVDDLFDEGLIG